MNRKELNRNVRALAASLGYDEQTYRTIVICVYPASNGHITQCDDEHANLVLLKLKGLAGARPAQETNQQQHRMIAKLMDILGWRWSDTAGYCMKIVHKKNTKGCTAGELSKIIQGMIATIDHHLKSGKIVMSEAKRLEYERHVRQVKSQKEKGKNKNTEITLSPEKDYTHKSQLIELPF